MRDIIDKKKKLCNYSRLLRTLKFRDDIIKNGDTYVVESLDEVKDLAQFGVTWDGFFIRNKYSKISIDSS